MVKGQPASTLMPAGFIGHGSPMNALELNEYTRVWRAFGRAVPRPRAVLCISAHWYINATAVTVMSRPRTIHDFYGFPPELFSAQYPAPGLPELGQEIRDAVKPTWVGADVDSWGLDHGTWSVLTHVFPDASVPVVQLSINAEKDLSYHFELGRQLAPLRQRGVLVVGSGNIVHNLRAVNPGLRDDGYDWAQRFDEEAREQLLSQPGDAVALGSHRHYREAAPTPDHFIPLMYFAGLASESAQPVSSIAHGYAYGSISMAAYGLGVEGVGQQDSADLGGSSTPPLDVPADESNI
jgi:4,5-DOPA dioxygenase extradiol